MKTIDQNQVAEFSNTMLSMLNNALLGISISIGYKTGLFESMAGQPPATSEQIAQQAKLNTRYVKEWLGAMVTGGIINYDASTSCYHLCEEHAAVLTHTAGLNNMARFAPLIGQLCSVEEQMINCFKHGGGIDYSAYPQFMDLWSEVNAERLDATLISQVIPLIPEVQNALQSGIKVLDVGCGDGHVLRLLAKAFPNSHFVGFDLVQTAIDNARQKARDARLNNIEFQAIDILNIDKTLQFNFICAFDAIHDLAKPSEVLTAIKQLLTPNGAFMMVDLAASSHLENNMNHPLGPWLYTSSCMHCVSVSMHQGGEGLGAMWGQEKALELLNASGFEHVTIKRINDDPFNNYYIAKS